MEVQTCKLVQALSTLLSIMSCCSFLFHSPFSITLYIICMINKQVEEVEVVEEVTQQPVTLPFAKSIQEPGSSIAHPMEHIDITGSELSFVNKT